MVCLGTNAYFIHDYSAYDYTIGAMDKAIVKTDIQIAVPHGCYGRVGECQRVSNMVHHYIDSESVCLFCLNIYNE